MYQIFEVKLKPAKIDLRDKLDEVNKLNWHLNGEKLIKYDDGLQYVLDLSNFSLKCLVGELFVIEEGEWSPLDYPAREEVVNMAIKELQKLPFSFEVIGVERVVKIKKRIG
jgi:hypothetical protein